MAFTDADARADVDSYTPPEEPHPAAMAPPTPIQAAQLPAPAKVTPSFLDSVISGADTFASHFGSMHAERDAAAGLMTGAVKTANSLKSALESMNASVSQSAEGGSQTPGFPEQERRTGETEAAADPFTPMYNDARDAVLRLRDTIAVPNPNVADNLIQGAAQFAPSFLMASRVIGSIGGISKLASAARFVAADTAAAATTQDPHDPRLADTFSLLMHSEGKFGDMLRTIDNGTGNLVGHYIDYLTDRTNETEAAGRFKNVLDSYGASAAIGGLAHAGASIFKQGWSALHFAADNGITKMSDLKPPANLEVEGGPETREGPSGAIQANDSYLTDLGMRLAGVNAGSGSLKLHDIMTEVSQKLDGGEPMGAFYKDLATRLAGKNLATSITDTSPKLGNNPAFLGKKANVAGTYHLGSDEVGMFPKGFRDNPTMLHTLTHEAVHAATLDAVESSPAMSKHLQGLMDDIKTLSPKNAEAYGLTKPREFVAEAESNPQFAEMLRTTKDSSGETLWDQYKAIIGKMLGLGGTAVASKEFEDVMTRQENKGA